MARYIVNKNTQSNGDHEVHVLNGTCNRLPDAANQLDLGEFDSCQPAVTEAKQTYPQSNGCFYCSKACNTG